jgi:hypothetical protein
MRRRLVCFLGVTLAVFVLCPIPPSSGAQNLHPSLLAAVGSTVAGLECLAAERGKVYPQADNGPPTVHGCGCWTDANGNNHCSCWN